jgi:hypothetical protein
MAEILPVGDRPPWQPVSEEERKKLKAKPVSLVRQIKKHAREHPDQLELIVSGLFHMAGDLNHKRSLEATRLILERIDGLVPKDITHHVTADKTIIKGLRAAQAPALPGEEPVEAEYQVLPQNGSGLVPPHEERASSDYLPVQESQPDAASEAEPGSSKT